MKIKNFSEIQSLFFDNKSLKQTIFKNTFWLILAEGITRILKLFLVFYISRILGVVEYGKFTFALSFVSILTVFADLGLNSLTVREISREKEKDFPFILSLKLILSLIVLALIFIGSFFIAPNIEVQKLIWILGLYVLINGFSAIIYSFFRAKEKMQYEFFAKTSQGIIVVILGFFVLLNFPSVRNLGFSYLFASVSALFLTCFIFRSKIYSLRLHFNKEIWKNLLILSLPIGLSGIFGTIHNTIGSVLMGAYNQVTQLGWYSASLKVADIILVLFSLLSASFFPVLSKFYKQSKEKFQKIWDVYFQLILSLSVPLVVGGIVLAPKIIDLIYDPSYFPSILTFQILILFVGIYFVSGPFNQILFIFNQQQKLFWISLFGAIISIVLNLILIPSYSLYGVAFVRVFTRVLMFFLLLRFSLKSTIINFFNFKLALSLMGISFSSVLMFFVISFPKIYNLHVLLVVIIGVVVYAISLLGCRKIILKIVQE